MPDPREVKKHIERFGGDDAKTIAAIIMQSTGSNSLARADGMEAIRRLSAIELEARVLEALESRGYGVSTVIDIRYGLGDSHFAHGSSVREAISEAASVCTGKWPPELSQLVDLYLGSQEDRVGPSAV